MTARPPDPKAEFLKRVADAISRGTFVKLTLGKFRGTEAPKKMIATLIDVKGATRLNVVTSFARKDVTKNFDCDAGVAHIGQWLGDKAFAATVFSTEKDFELTYNAKGAAKLIAKKATFSAVPPRTHDRAKDYLVEPSRPYLTALGVSDEKGAVKPSM